MEAAAVEVGLTLAQFYDLTPRRFFNLYDRFVDREIRHARQEQVATALLANIHRDPDQRSSPFTIDDFAPPLRGKVAESGPRFEGPAFLRPCNECGVPKWQGHLISCKTGAVHFASILSTVTAASQHIHDLSESAGKPYLEPKKQ